MNINSAVSKNIKHIREQKKLTLDMAASVTGVSRSMLAQIERGDANPTISVLWKIATGYKVAFTSLIEQENDISTIIPFDPTEKIIESDGKFLIYPVFKFEENRSFEAHRVTVLPGAVHNAVPHLSGTEEYITVYTGSIEVTVQEEVFTLNVGDSIRFKADIPHSYRNVGLIEASLNMLLYYE